MKSRYLFVLEDRIQNISVGGVKSIYNVYKQWFITLTIGWKEIHIPIKRGFIEQIIYLRPYKRNWDTERYRLPFNYWGKPNHALTAAIIQLERDFYNLREEIAVLNFVKYYDEIDNRLVKLVRKETSKFTFEIKPHLF